MFLAASMLERGYGCSVDAAAAASWRSRGQAALERDAGLELEHRAMCMSACDTDPGGAQAAKAETAAAPEAGPSPASARQPAADAITAA